MNDTNVSNSGNPLLRDKRVRALIVTAAVFAMLGLLWLIWWWLVLSQREVTNNAYIGGHQVLIVAQAAGTVAAVRVDDTQRVQAGQLLVELDPADARLARDRAAAALARAVREVRQLRSTAGLNEAVTDARRLDLEQAQDALQRRLPLIELKAIAPEQLANARRQVALAKSALAVSLKQTEAARDVAGSGGIAQHPAVQAARASYVGAWLSLARTRVEAPIAGVVAQRTVQPGQQVQLGASLMRVVPADSLWVEANLKESQLRNLRVGQSVKVNVDLYGSDSFKGRVAGFSPGTGSVFALLPPQNAAGNWVKVVQRVPVRIALDRGELAKRPLLIGLSAEVSIDTHERGGSQITAASSPSRGPSLTHDLGKAEQEADRIIAEHSRDERVLP